LKSTLSAKYLDVTELSGDEVTQEQVERMCHRYYWAGSYSRGKDVLECACGSGQGLGYLQGIALSFKAGDFSNELLERARKHYCQRIDLRQFDAQKMPFSDSVYDVIILFEAIYYLPDARLFVNECCRVLRKGGKVLIASANKDLFDFNPSPFTYKYYGVSEFKKLFEEAGFFVECYGNTPIDAVSWRQKIFRPIKMVFSKLGFMPKSMAAKKIFKRLVFGKLVSMPAEIKDGMFVYNPPIKISVDQPDKKHKVIYCVATKKELKKEND
jgi:ubiquinone/menaquinone biosynthesis C-methylase UbiE